MDDNGNCLALIGGCLLVVFGALGWLGVQEARRRGMRIKIEEGAAFVDTEIVKIVGWDGKRPIVEWNPNYLARNRRANREALKDEN